MPDSTDQGATSPPSRRPENTALRKSFEKQRTSSQNEKNDGIFGRISVVVENPSSSGGQLLKPGMINNDRRGSSIQMANDRRVSFGGRRASIKHGSVGGFDSILSKVSATYRIDNISPALAGESALSINRESSSISVSKLPPNLPGRRESVSGRRESVSGRNRMPPRRASISQSARQDSQPTIPQESFHPSLIRRISSEVRNQEQLAALGHSIPFGSGENPKNAEVGLFGTILADDDEIGRRISITSSNSNKHHGFTAPLSRQPFERRGFLEKKESKMFVKRATWNKGAMPLIPKGDPDSDQESVGSNDSYNSSDLAPVAFKVPMKSFAGELMRRQSKGVVIEKEERFTKSLAPTIQEVSLEIPIQIPSIQKLSIPTVAPGTSLLVPGSDIVHVRRASFSANLFQPQLNQSSKQDALPARRNTLAPQVAPSLAIPTAHTTLSIAQATANAAKRRQSVKFNAEPTSSTLSSQVPLGTDPSFNPLKVPDTNTLVTPQRRKGSSSKMIPKSEVEESIDAWKRLKKEARGSIKDRSTTQAKFSDIGEVVNVMKDLKSLGMDSNLVQEVDKGTLMAVVGVKKWAKASLEKRAKANHPLRKHVKSVEHRLANEIPQTIFFDLISEVGPILKRCADEYKIQLGEKHIFTKECNSHLQALLLKGRNMGLDIPGMVDKSKNSLLETNHGTSPDSTFEPPQSCCIPMPFFSRSARVVPEMVEYEKRQLTGGNKSRKTIGREDDEDDELDSPMTPNAHLVIDIP